MEPATMMNNIFGNNMNGIDFSLNRHNSHIYESYQCEIYERQDGLFRLRYIDNNDILNIVDPLI